MKYCVDLISNREDFIKNKIIIIGLLVCSVVLSFLQWNTASKVLSVSVIGAKEDIKCGERINEGHLIEIEIDPKNKIESYSTKAEDFLGKTANTDIPRGALLSRQFFSVRLQKEVQKGNAMTAVKLLPDSAICWTVEPESILDVYFVDRDGAVEVLGNVKLIGAYDQNMSTEDMLFYAVVEGTESVIAKIVQKRELGRIELVKTQ